jgi:hypothetical protein
MDFKQLSEQFSAMSQENEFLKESYSSMAQAILAFDDAGWNTTSTASGTGSFTLDELQKAAQRIRETSEGNPLLKRGCGLRTSYIFGRGVEFGNLQPRFKKTVDIAANQEVLFSPEAQVINERSHFTDGQFFVLGNVSTKTFQRVPFDQITAVVTNPDDAEDVWYYRRTWTRRAVDLTGNGGKEVQVNEWYPADTYAPENGRYVGRIQNQPVNLSFRMFASRVNRRAGNVWGLPDAFPALPWAHAYNEYLKDGSRMLKALSMFAWQLRSKTRTGQTNAAAAIATPSTAGSTAVMGDNMELTSMPRANSVDLGDGRPLGSMVASALEVSVVALLSDPGSSGAYGTAQTLDVPTLKAMEARQHVWTLFYRRIMNFIGAKDVEINWPKIETEPSQRMAQALVLAHEAGALWDDEFREAIIEVLDIKKLRTTVPTAGATSDSGSSIVPSQGNSGAAGSMQDNANDLRAQDAQPTA